MFFAISDIIICSCLLLRYKILRFFSTRNRNICQQFHCRRWCHCHVPHFHSKKYYQKVAPIFEAIKINEKVIDRIFKSKTSSIGDMSIDDVASETVMTRPEVAEAKTKLINYGYD